MTKFSTMIHDTETGDQLDYVRDMDVSALDEQQVILIGRAIATKRASLPR